MKTLRRISFAILFLACLSLFSSAVRHVVLGGERFGVLTDAFRYFVEFPVLAKRVYEEYTAIPPYHLIAEDGFVEIHALDYDLFALNAHSEKDKYVFVLSNLRTDSILHTWYFPEEQFSGLAEWFDFVQPMNPILLSDRALVGILAKSNTMFLLDRDSEIVWQNNSRYFHHSINPSNDGYAWACTSADAYTKNEYDGSTISFRDDFITRLNMETGEIVFEKSLSEILLHNGYLSLVHGYGNEEHSEGTDLFHLNDIEPILFDGEFWKKGDLLLSLRNRSTILHYRPATDEILRLISGPFLSQHDVDVISDTEISIFNNNRAHTIHLTEEGNEIEKDVRLTLRSSEIVVYNFADSSFRKPFLDLMQKEKIFTGRQGLHTFLSNGDLFIESTESGKIYLLRDGEVILRRYANKANESGFIEYPHWMRIYENVNFN